VGGIPPSAILPIFKARATSILRSIREERATQKIGKSAIGPPGWLEKGLSASLLVRYASQRIRSSLAPSIQTLLKPTVCLPLMRRCTKLIFLLLLFLARKSWGDGGAIQFQGDAGPFHVTVFTLPPILSAGPVDLTVLIQNRSKLDPLLNALVTLDLTALPGADNGKASLQKEAWIPPACALNLPASLVNIPAKLNHGENRLLYGALVQVPYSGIWKLKVNIQCDSEAESVETLLKVNSPAPPPLAYWQLFILPPMAVLGFILNRVARQSRSQEPGARSTQRGAPGS
jgi:hypothetical protein